MEQSSILQLSPTEFEKWCFEILKGYAEENGLADFRIYHDKRIKASDGRYQVDIYLEFKIAGLQFKVLCECKRYKSRISRDKVEILHSRLVSVGAQKGVIISTSDFQRGAVEYGKIHGIALIKVEDYHFEYLSHSSGEAQNEDDPFLYAERRLPPYVAYDYTACSDKPRKVYPTSAMIQKLLVEQTEKIKKVMGIDIDIDFPDV